MFSRSPVEEIVEKSTVNMNFLHCCRGIASSPRQGARGLLGCMRALGAAILLLPIALTAGPAQTVKPAPAGNVDNGKQLFASAGCATCHGNLAKGMNGLGP